MYSHDIELLCCPATGERLELIDGVADADGEIVTGKLRSVPGGRLYPIRNGIPRFVELDTYNMTWDYKWTRIDQGKGLNYRILDKNDPAYAIHDLFDRNGHRGRAFQFAAGRLALDVGCGVGQYSIKLLQEVGPAKVISVDLTGAVDLFRKIVIDRFPEFRRRILIVQASALDLPFRDGTFDYAFSLGVLHHTGDTRRAIRNVARVIKEGGEFNVWVYGAVPVHIDNAESGRSVDMTLGRFIPRGAFYIWAMFQIRLFRKLPHRVAVSVIKMFSSDVWYRLCRIPVAGYFFKAIFSTVMHPNRDYRYINNYDGWCNTWAETWTEGELFPTLAECNMVIRGISDWQTGLWCEKKLGFYR
jgi:SAM-dependent methyltransferase